MEHINYKTKLSTSVSNNTHQSRFKILLFIFRLGGLPLGMQSISRINTLYNVVLPVCVYFTDACLFMDTFVHRRQLMYAMKKLRLLIGFILMAWMHISLSYRKSNIEHLLTLTDSFTWEELPTRDPDTGYLTKAGYIPIIQNLTKYLLMLGFVFHNTQSAVRMVTSHDMILTNWYPFDASVSPAYEIANLTQAIASLFSACLMFAYPGMYATLVCVACSQLEKLRATLLDIGQTHTTQPSCGAVTDLQEEGGQTHASEEQFCHMQKQLNSCILHHQEIKRYMEELEETMNLPLCGLLLLFLSLMCFDAFSAVTSWGDHADISQALVVYIATIGAVYIYCWLGNELSEQAESVRDAAWGCNWVGTPVSFQRCLVFIIATANKEFRLTAGKFVPVCNSTMMNMMNQSVSFFMFLLHMKDKNKTNKEI